MVGPKPIARELDSVARELLAPLLAGGCPEPGWTLAGWDAEQGICLLFESRDTHVLLELEQRNDRLDCYARTARFNICARRQFGDRSMNDADRRLVDAVIGVIRERETRLPVVTRRRRRKSPCARCWSTAC